MFEDATFETMGTIHTRSRNWMIATFGLNASFLAALIAIPLFHPSALPQMVYVHMLDTPAPIAEQKPLVRPEHQAPSTSELFEDTVLAPPKIHAGPWIPGKGEDPGPMNPISLDMSGPGPGSADNPLGGHRVQPVVQQIAKPRPISSGVMEGMLVHKVIPTYPAIGRAVRAQGTIQLQATISRDGTIENLRVVGGPPLLQQAAVDAVKQWRYRPYLLNGEPVEVETTINVDFKLD